MADNFKNTLWDQYKNTGADSFAGLEALIDLELDSFANTGSDQFVNSQYDQFVGIEEVTPASTNIVRMELSIRYRKLVFAVRQ
jgi:hypothetical protein